MLLNTFPLKTKVPGEGSLNFLLSFRWKYNGSQVVFVPELVTSHVEIFRNAPCTPVAKIYRPNPHFPQFSKHFQDPLSTFSELRRQHTLSKFCASAPLLPPPCVKRCACPNSLSPQFSHALLLPLFFPAPSSLHCCIPGGPSRPARAS